MTTLALACFFVVLLALIACWSRAHKRANRAEQREGLQAKVSASRLERIGSLAKRVKSLEVTTTALAWENASQQEQVRIWRDRARDTQTLLMSAAFHADVNATALRGLLTNLARQELLRPDEAAGNVVRLERPAR